MRAPPHPGTLLRDEFLTPRGMSQSELAMRMGMSAKQVSLIVNGKARVTAETALKLERVTGRMMTYWMSAQCALDLHLARKKART